MIRIAILFLMFDGEHSKIGLSRLTDIFHSDEFELNILRIGNSANLKADISGDNCCGEFSGWEEGLKRIDLEATDLVLFANDTIGRFEKLNYFRDKNFRDIIKKIKQHQNSVFGEFSYFRMPVCSKAGHLVRWVRTDMFLVSSDIIRNDNRLFKSCLEIQNLLWFSRKNNMMFSDSVPMEFRYRIEQWLKPEANKNVWPGLPSASSQRVALKARCVLQELMFYKHMEERGVTFVDVPAVKRPLKRFALNALYSISKFFTRLTW